MTGHRPVRLTLSRRTGFDLQALSRSTNGLRAVSCIRPGPWGNPFIAGKHGSIEQCVRLHESALNGLIAITVDVATRDAAFALHKRADAHLHILAGVNLVCTCKAGAPCHATTLLHYANPLLFAAEIAASRAALAQNLV